MALVPTFATPPGFLGIERRDPGAAFTVAGIPLDIGTTNRAGARDGPSAIRRASRMLVDGAHPHHWVEPAASMDIADAGDFAIVLGDLAASLAAIEAQAAPLRHLVALGGEHGVTLPLLRALRKRIGEPLGLLQFDSHLDTWPENFGQRLAHGSVFYHALDEGLVDPRRMVQVGIRSPMGRDVRDWTLARGVTIIAAQEALEIGPAAVAERVRAVLGKGPAYLSFDIDALDPAFAPGTGTPVWGGLHSWQAAAILRALAGLRVAGGDVVEVSPPFDPTGATAIAAAHVATEILCLYGWHRLGK